MKEQLKGGVEMEEAHHVTLKYQSKEILKGYVTKRKEWDKDKER